jgi:tripeptide aminopeptidase
MSNPHTSRTATQTALAQHRITRLATQLPVHRAFHWLHLHQPQLRRWHLEFVAIPAPPFAEQARAQWFLERFTALGLTNVHLDKEGNALGELASPSVNEPFILLSAHLDTVFPAGTDTTPTENGPCILGPGACDNGAGLTALLAIIAALRHARIEPPQPILFAANVGEEGEGDLRGMRHLIERGPYRQRIAAALAIDGSGTAAAVTRGLGSSRFRATIHGPGGHSWTDATTPNPITLVARAISTLAALPSLITNLEPTSRDAPRTTFSPGIISGGTSINSIPESATVLLDLRSTDADQLELHATEVDRVFQLVVAQAPRTETLRLELQLIGDRPAAALPADSPLLYTLRAVDRHLGIRTELRLGSTDANLPLAHGIPAAALAAGGTGGGIHTLAEWYNPTGRETALRRILLTLLDLAQQK